MWFVEVCNFIFFLSPARQQKAIQDQSLCPTTPTSTDYCFYHSNPDVFHGATATSTTANDATTNGQLLALLFCRRPIRPRWFPH